MKYLLSIKTLLILVVLTLISCSYQDDYLNKNPEIEPVELFSITLNIVDKAQLALAGAQVILLDDQNTELYSKTSSDSGQVIFTDLPPGDYQIEALYEQVNGEMAIEIQNKNIETALTLDVINENYITQTASFIITGIQSDPRGSDAAANGTSSSYQAGSVVVNHIGGYEYIQLLALQDIDFAQTPYSVVFANNGKVGDKGWAQGGTATYKINLEQGKVKKGEFFYVGGKSKVLSGYGSCGKSTDMGHLNWIAIKDSKLEPGDGFGDPNSGLMGNISKDGQNTADGIAIFRSTQVDKESVPMDAVFYGTSIEGLYDDINDWGYRVPLRSDRYSSESTEHGKQEFFGQGNNVFLFSQPRSDVGDFIKLGGVTSSSKWEVARKSSIVQLSYCPGESSISDIEAATGVTVFTDNPNPGPIGPEAPEDKANLRVMSFNIRHDDPNDPYSLEQRKQYILDVILKEKLDVVGLQEFSNDWFEDWLVREMANNGYQYYLDSANSFSSPKVIFYKKDRFSVRASDTFQVKLTEKRSGSWVVLLDSKTQKQFFVINSHWTTVGSEDRVIMAQKVLEQIKNNSRNLPVICLGDFNAKPNTPEIMLLKSNAPMALNSAVDENLKTFHSWGPTGSSTIDYIFHSKELKVVKGWINRDSYQDLWPSDHWPVVASFIL